MIGMIFFIAIIFFVLIIFLKRNGKVSAQKKKILNMAHELALFDIKNKKYIECGRWFNEYDLISYEEMLYKFWIPLDSYCQSIQNAYRQLKQQTAHNNEEAR